jgi:monoterpene epsilon-lactone hydrolase
VTGCRSAGHQGIAPGHIAFAGDSAGGWLAVTVQLRAREEGLPRPAAAMLISPWTDLEVNGESYETNRDKDPFFQREIVHGLARNFLGEAADPRDPLASPLYADLSGLGPVYIQVGGDETLLDDARRLDSRARKAGVDARLDVFPGMLHTFQMAAGRAPEADDAIRRMADWVRPKLDL